LEIEDVPENRACGGGGYIGMELGTFTPRSAAKWF